MGERKHRFAVGDEVVIIGPEDESEIGKDVYGKLMFAQQMASYIGSTAIIREILPITNPKIIKYRLAQANGSPIRNWIWEDMWLKAACQGNITEEDFETIF